ncbi:allatostatins [Temnothorax nylanderi]|uniref:allatostatins n=1 Tax=Temnothorax nylanderi TaxID=102681 RepID=UPI003A86FFAF
MKPRTSLITTRIIMFYLLSVVGSTTAIEDASSSSLHISRFQRSLNNLEYEQPEKKAYIAEYKRPVYNFGIGKRWVDSNEDKRTRQFSFGVGKRDYRFGLGKRNNGYHPLSLDYFPTDNMEGYQSREDNSNDFIEDKRGKQYDFGVGKRSVWKLATGETVGRRLNDVTVPKYLFGLGNALDENEDLIQ